MPDTKPLILLVNQDHDNAEQLLQVLEPEFSCMVVYSGQEAMSIFEPLFLKIKAVVISNNLADMDALATFMALKKISFIPEFILISDVADLDLSVQSLKHGAYDFLLNPVDAETLRHTTRHAIANIDYLSKLEQVSNQLFLNQLDINMHISGIRDLFTQKRQQGQIASIQEIVAAHPSNGSYRQGMEESLALLDPTQLTATSRQGPPRLLYIEDDPKARQNFDLLLSPFFDVDTVPDSQSALDYLKDGPEIDLILLDVYLPDILGDALLPQIKALCPTVPVVIITAYQETALAIQTLRNGASDFITKPILKADLLATIANVRQHAYFQAVSSQLQRDVFKDQLSYKFKLSLLTELIQQKSDRESPILMADIYAFFPRLSQLKIPEQVQVPEKVIDDGIMLFIDELQQRLNAGERLAQD